jgi:type VI secretion system secreted protein Hcp
VLGVDQANSKLKIIKHIIMKQYLARLFNQNLAIVLIAVLVLGAFAFTNNSDKYLFGVDTAYAAQVDYFLKIDGVDGESTDDKHKNEIDVESFSWGVSNPGSAVSGGGAGAGKVQMQDLNFMMMYNKSSPVLMLACASGKHFKSATLTARKAGENQQEFLIYKFTDIIISSYQTSGAGDIPTDAVSFNFAKVEVEYKVQRADGSLGDSVRAGWDLKANKAITPPVILPPIILEPTAQ